MCPLEQVYNQRMNDRKRQTTSSLTNLRLYLCAQCFHLIFFNLAARKDESRPAFIPLTKKARWYMKQ